MKFSVIIPLYNKADYILRAINSVIKQSYSHFDLIIVNDGSTDNSLSVVSCINDPRIKVINQKNQGVSVARNNGAELSDSEFICFLDADDEWDFNHLEKIKNLITCFPDAGLYATGHRVKENLIIKNAPSYFSSDFKGYLDDFFYASLRGSIANSSKVAICRDGFFKAGGFPVGVEVGEDLFLWIRLALVSKVAYDSSISVTIHRDYDTQRVTRAGKVPYPLVYFADKRDFLKKNISLKKYIERVALRHIAGSAMARDYSGGIKRVWALFKISYILGILSFFILIIPQNILLKLSSKK
jgi:glycosyltransferase involved in cell wall biosynthesis